jgi:hypothetical protein
VTDTSEFSSQAKEVLNRYEFCRAFLLQRFVPYLPEYDSGVDFILYREEDDLLLKVQLKARWTVEEKYFGRNIWVAFPDEGLWYLAPHDVMVKHGAKHSESNSWKKGGYSKPYLTTEMRTVYAEYEAEKVIVAVSKEYLESSKTQAATKWNES